MTIRLKNTGTGAIVRVRDDKKLGSEWVPAEGSPAPVSETPDDSWSNKQLKAYAEEHAIDLGDARNKAGFLAAIVAAEGTDDDESDDSPDF